MPPRLARLAVAIVAAAPAVASSQSQGAGPLADDPTLIALAVSLACMEAPPEAAPPMPSGEPELELVATVRAKALTFDQVPKVKVAFDGSGPRRTVWRTERVNLPLHPEAGVTYRDVRVRLTITSSVEGIGQLLADAKRASAGIRIESDPVPTPAAPAPAPVKAR